MKNFFYLLIFMLAMGVSAQTEFSKEALSEEFTNLEGDDVTFASILEKHKGKTIYIDIWASWCKDCRKGLPGVKTLQAQYDDIEFIFLSLDKKIDSWKKGIEKLGISEGDHYFIKSGWKASEFCKSIDLDWIPRYMIVNSEGKIELFKAIETDDQKLIDKLKTIQ